MGLYPLCNRADALRTMRIANIGFAVGCYAVAATEARNSISIERRFSERRGDIPKCSGRSMSDGPLNGPCNVCGQKQRISASA
jgi:hypothetical protein